MFTAINNFYVVRTFGIQFYDKYPIDVVEVKEPFTKRARSIFRISDTISLLLAKINGKNSKMYDAHASVESPSHCRACVISEQLITQIHCAQFSNINNNQY